FLIHSWFPQRQFILLSGLTNFLGILGAIFAQKPLAIYIDSHGWRDAQVLISGIGCIILVLLIVFIKNNNIKKDPVSIKSFNKIISKPVYWLLGLYVGCMHFTLAGFGALWGASYMGIVFHETSVKAAAMASFLYFGSLLGSLFIGFVTKLFRTKTSAMCFISTVGVLSSLAFINIPDVKYLGETLIFIVGFSTSGFLLGYDVVGIITPKDLVGTASGFLNTILVGLSSLSVSLIGYFLVLGATSPHHYSSVDYRHAMIALVVSFSIALITALYLQYKRIDK
ncbi:MAG: hypothetical protein HOI53_03350, partial [Francisellaceae bacterium]|nr:hypothetical protein [Francisellaceae bacterium]